MYPSAIPDFPGSGFATDLLTAKFRLQMTLCRQQVIFRNGGNNYSIKYPIMMMMMMMIIIIIIIISEESDSGKFNVVHIL
jgi:hypothetical protein